MSISHIASRSEGDERLSVEFACSVSLDEGVRQSVSSESNVALSSRSDICENRVNLHPSPHSSSTHRRRERCPSHSSFQIP